MKEQKNYLGFAVIVWIIWLVITIGGLALQTSEDTPIEELATSAIIYGVVAASIFALAVVAYKKWWRETGLKGPDEPRNLRYAILPAVLILSLTVLSLTGGVSANILIIVLINTLFVGFSEELACRGILLYGFSTKFSMVRSIIFVSILFGLMHGLNGFITGDFGAATTQAIINIFAGVWYTAVRVRTTTIIPIMILHTFWDFSGILIAAGVAAGTINELFGILPLGVNVILIIYGFWLLWGISKDEKQGKQVMAAA